MIDLLAQVDEYCERTDFQFFSEPLNYLSNLWFWVAAWLAFHEIKRSGLLGSLALRGLVIWLVLVGLGSGFFHSYATGWAKICDVGFIGIFVLWFLWFWLREILNCSVGRSILYFGGFFVCTGILQVIFMKIPVNGSQGYFGVAVYLAGMGVQQIRRFSGARTLLLAALVFCLSLIFRTMDQSICSAWPYGTHFIWHSLNAVVCYLSINGLREELEWKTRGGKTAGGSVRT